MDEAPTPDARDRGRAAGTALGLARIALGAIFLWAFLDKVFGLGYSTPAAKSFLSGGNPTAGYLGSSTGPLAGFFQAIAGDPVTNILFLAGLLGVGLALVFGIGVRMAGFAGALMVLLMWSSHPPWVKAAGVGGPNPFFDDHLVYACLLLVFAFMHAGRYVGLGRIWARLPLVRRVAWLE